MARREKRSLRDEPVPEGEDWVEWGGELVWAAGFTSGGVPYGVSADQFRASMMAEQRGAGWVRARRTLGRVFDTSATGGDTSVDIGRVQRLDEGLSRTGFWADVRIDPDPDERSGRYVVLLPNHDVDSSFDTRVAQEAEILEQLSKRHLTFRTPRIVAVVREAGHAVIVESFVPGIALDLRASRQPRVKPWQVVGEVAAAIHALDTTILDGALDAYATRRDHAEAELPVFEGLDDPVVPVIDDARVWVREHLPPPTQSAFVHGDLLGQNILLPYSDEPALRPGIIDWEFAQLGDPAMDLAVVTRGVRRPFQIDEGLDRLLDSYATAGGVELTAAEVHFWELCMAAHWYRDALDERRIHPPEQELHRVRRVLERAIARS